MPWSMLPILLSLACGQPLEPAPAPPAPEAGAEQAANIRAAVSAWRADPGPELHSAVLSACERGLEVENPSAELDMALGDGLSNVLLRPDLGLPRLQRRVEALDGEGVDAWLSALARSGDVDGFGLAVERVSGERLDLDHPTARLVIHQSSLRPEVDWLRVRDDLHAVSLVELLDRGARRPVDRPVESVGAALETLPILFPGWEIEVATARSTLPSDPDPTTHLDLLPAANGTRRVLGFARTPAELRAPGVALDLQRPAQAVVVAASATSAAGMQLTLAFEGRYIDGVLWTFSSNDPERVVTWLDAAEDLTQARKAGKTEQDTATSIRQRHAAAMLQGR